MRRKGAKRDSDATVKAKTRMAGGRKFSCTLLAGSHGYVGLIKQSTSSDHCRARDQPLYSATPSSNSVLGHPGHPRRNVCGVVVDRVSNAPMSALIKRLAWRLGDRVSTSFASAPQVGEEFVAPV